MKDYTTGSVLSFWPCYWRFIVLVNSFVLTIISHYYPHHNNLHKTNGKVQVGLVDGDSVVPGFMADQQTAGFVARQRSDNFLQEER